MFLQSKPTQAIIFELKPDLSQISARPQLDLNWIELNWIELNWIELSLTLLLLLSRQRAREASAFIRHRAFRLVGRVCSPCLVFSFSDVLMSCFLNLKRAHSPTDHLHRLARVTLFPLFTPFLCLFFRPPFWQRLNPKAFKMRTPKQLKIIKNWKKRHRNAPTVRTCKKTESGRGQTSEIDNHYNTFSCFSKCPELSK